MRAREVMKEAIWRVDRTGDYTFSDLIPETQSSITYFVSGEWDHWVPRAASRVFSEFRGKKVAIDAIKDFVLINTLFIQKIDIPIFRKK